MQNITEYNGYNKYEEDDMLKKLSIKKCLLVVVIICMLMCTACGNKQESSIPDNTQQNSNTQLVKESETNDAEKQVPAAEQNKSDEQIPPVIEKTSDIIKKIICATDDEGIYSTVITLSDAAADKGVVEMVYSGASGTPQENSVVCTFRIEYYKESAGTFEINTFYNGDVYQNYHHKENVKVDNTFNAGVRAGSIVISYTPDGGETQEIYSATAEQFR